MFDRVLTREVYRPQKNWSSTFRHVRSLTARTEAVLHYFGWIDAYWQVRKVERVLIGQWTN